MTSWDDHMTSWDDHMTSHMAHTFSFSVGVPKWSVLVTSVVPSRYWAPESHRYSSSVLSGRSVEGVGLGGGEIRRIAPHLSPHSSPLTPPHSSPLLTPHPSSPFTPHSSPLTPHPSSPLLTPDPSPLPLHLSLLTPHPSPLTLHPSPSPFTPHPSPFTPHSSPVVYDCSMGAGGRDGFETQRHKIWLLPVAKAISN